MKSAQDPRHKKRVRMIQSLFGLAFGQKINKGASALITRNLEAIDSTIVSAAPQWSVPQIAKIDLAILRLAVYELCIEKKQPPKVIIDEAIELAKEFGNDNSAKFINGALGAVVKNMTEETKTSKVAS